MWPLGNCQLALGHPLCMALPLYCFRASHEAAAHECRVHVECDSLVVTQREHHGRARGPNKVGVECVDGVQCIFSGSTEHIWSATHSEDVQYYLMIAIEQGNAKKIQNTKAIKKASNSEYIRRPCSVIMGKPHIVTGRDGMVEFHWSVLIMYSQHSDDH